MRRELIVKTRSLGGSSDLTLLAPIKPGLVPSLESVTYKTRLKRLLGTLNAGRTSSHEYSLLRAFSDAVERVGKIHSVRVAIVEPDSVPPQKRDRSKSNASAEPGSVLLSVTFDGEQESYLRLLWQKVGILLDVIFCNTVDYVPAYNHIFEEWADWVRKVQIETDFFYGMPGHTVDDVQYLRKQELLHRQKPAGNALDPLPTRQFVRSAEEIAWSQVSPVNFTVLKDVGRQGLRALVLIYRLSAYYLPGTDDGAILHRAVRELLLEFIRLNDRNELDPILKEGRKRFDAQNKGLIPARPARPTPTLPKEPPKYDRDDVQAGILRPIDRATHGCLLLIAFRDRKGAANFLGAMTKEWVTKDSAPELPSVNLALTYEGLRAAGLSESQLELFPQEFREGMEARASVLGDFRTNHPRRWRLPVRNFTPPGAEPGQEPQTVELSSVHAVVQIRVGVDNFRRAKLLERLGERTREELDPEDPLGEIVNRLHKAHEANIEILAVQPMFRHLNDAGKIREHFGFADGGSDPVLDPELNGKIYDRNQVQLGEFLIGYDNQADFAEDPRETPEHAEKRRKRLEFLRNGTFLVIRKLSQDVRALEEAVKRENTGLDKELVLSKMMGRTRGGDPIVRPGSGNDFDYSDEDPPGSLCPFHAHIRRANPRTLDNPQLPPPPGRRTPRLMRRGMSYGPLYDANDPKSAAKPRGMVFMAYNASIAEQFEVVQRWITGGNSSGGFSGQSDPFLGVPPIGQRKWFSFELGGHVHRIALDGSDVLLADPRPFVRLEWGIYLFTPSIKGLGKIAEVAGAGRAAEPVWSADDGLARIKELLEIEKTDLDAARRAWKALLEDPEAQRTYQSAGVWAAIRRDFGGVLQTRAYGVIVADPKAIREVLADTQNYLVTGYHARMKDTIGEIFLGLDDIGANSRYRKDSEATNNAIRGLGDKATFELARDATRAAIDKLIADEQKLAQEFRDQTWELNLDVREIVDRMLEALCQEWFGFPEGTMTEVVPGGARWDSHPGKGDPVRYPGHFTAPSRFFFQPHPGTEVKDYGVEYGTALRKAFGKLVTRHRDNPPVFKETPLMRAILNTFPGRDQDEMAGSTIAGAMMGFLPTLDGNLRLSLNEWLRDGSFWSLRSDLTESTIPDPFARAKKLLEPALKRAMLLRPSPELIWRTPAKDGLDFLGRFKVGTQDTIVLALVSATQHHLASDPPDDKLDVYPIFGGDRWNDPHPPTHACPAYAAAMAALLGFVYALLETKASMRPSLAPLALTLDGVTPPPPPAPPVPAVQPSLPAQPAQGVQPSPVAAPSVAPPAQARVASVPAPVAPVGRKYARAAVRSGVGKGHLLVADGDSWHSYRHWGEFGKLQNIADYLTEPPYEFAVDKLAIPSTRLHDFYDDKREKASQGCHKQAADSRRLRELIDKVKYWVRRSKTPTAILLSASGTDVVEERLTPLLNDAASGPPALDPRAVTQQVDVAMECWLKAILDRIIGDLAAIGATVPVFIHGYDFPVPDCRILSGWTSEDHAWLWPSFKAKGYESSKWPTYPTKGTPIMKDLIVALNTMQKRVAGMPKYQGKVFHVDLTGTLSNRPADYFTDWDNELHASAPGFTALTKKYADALVANIPALQGRS